MSQSSSSASKEKEFLWQLSGNEFGKLFDLCTHSQAAEIRAKTVAPIARRLRRTRKGKENYEPEGSSSTKKKRDRKSI